MLFLSLICFALALLGVFWVLRAFSTRDETPTERADLDRAGGIIFTVVCLCVGGVALYLYSSDFLAPEPGLSPDTRVGVSALTSHPARPQVPTLPES